MTLINVRRGVRSSDASSAGRSVRGTLNLQVNYNKMKNKAWPLFIHLLIIILLLMNGLIHKSILCHVSVFPSHDQITNSLRALILKGQSLLMGSEELKELLNLTSSSSSPP